MDMSEIVGSAGVTILLVGFALTATGRLRADCTTNLVLNFSGATIACVASAMIGFKPFVILEGTWAIVAALSLLRQRRAPARGA